MKRAPAPYVTEFKTDASPLIFFDFRTLKRATILFTEPGRGQHIEQEHVGCESVALRKAITAARKTFDRVLALESKRTRAQSPQPTEERKR